VKRSEPDVRKCLNPCLNVHVAKDVIPVGSGAVSCSRETEFSHTAAKTSKFAAYGIGSNATTVK